MGGIISLSDKPEETWFAAGWAFRQVLEDVISRHPEDSEMAEELRSGEALAGVSMDLMEPAPAARVTEAMKRVAAGILSGEIRSGILDKPYGNAATVEQYQLGLRELLKIFPAD